MPHGELTDQQHDQAELVEALGDIVDELRKQKPVSVVTSAPIVRVSSPAVTVQPARVIIDRPAYKYPSYKHTHVRDAHGRIIYSISEPIDG